jgi:hypothetical protein
MTILATISLHLQITYISFANAKDIDNVRIRLE